MLHSNCAQTQAAQNAVPALINALGRRGVSRRIPAEGLICYEDDGLWASARAGVTPTAAAYTVHDVMLHLSRPSARKFQGGTLHGMACAYLIGMILHELDCLYVRKAVTNRLPLEASHHYDYVLRKQYA